MLKCKKKSRFDTQHRHAHRITA
jgi:hypothetical protein